VIGLLGVVDVLERDGAFVVLKQDGERGNGRERFSAYLRQGRSRDFREVLRRSRDVKHDTLKDFIEALAINFQNTPRQLANSCVYLLICPARQPVKVFTTDWTISISSAEKSDISGSRNATGVRRVISLVARSTGVALIAKSPER
jgi:hypothetical protein